ncbi:MAG: hypothetical protein PHP44_10620 [Kiritimatiellae bacterium]|nr:hypothetical protein [Kiritimatiellia bacterium]
MALRLKTVDRFTAMSPVGFRPGVLKKPPIAAALKEPPLLSPNATAKEVMQNRLKSIHVRERLFNLKFAGI